MNKQLTFRRTKVKKLCDGNTMTGWGHLRMLQLVFCKSTMLWLQEGIGRTWRTWRKVYRPPFCTKHQQTAVHINSCALQVKINGVSTREQRQE